MPETVIETEVKRRFFAKCSIPLFGDYGRSNMLKYRAAGRFIS
jgi:hypothetical protein